MEEIDLKKLFELFWSKRITVVAIIAISIVVGGIYSYGFVTPMYKSATTMVLTKSEGGAQNNEVSTESITTSDITLNSKLVATYSELIRSKSVIRQVISNLGIRDLDENSVKRNVSVGTKKDTEVIEITVTNKNAMYAAKIANEVAQVFSEKVALEIYDINNVHIVDEAEVATGPYNINHKKDILIFMFIGLALSLVYVFVLSVLDTTVKSAEDIEKIIALPVLTSISMYDFDSDKGGK